MGELRVKTIVLLKKCVTGTGIFSIIIDKFSYREESDPIVLFVINKSLGINLHCTILSLGLAIKLRVKSNGEFLLDPREVT